MEEKLEEYLPNIIQALKELCNLMNNFTKETLSQTKKQDSATSEKNNSKSKNYDKEIKFMNDLIKKIDDNKKAILNETMKYAGKEPERLTKRGQKVAANNKKIKERNKRGRARGLEKVTLEYENAIAKGDLERARELQKSMDKQSSFVLDAGIQEDRWGASQSGVLVDFLQRKQFSQFSDENSNKSTYIETAHERKKSFEDLNKANSNGEKKDGEDSSKIEEAKTNIKEAGDNVASKINELGVACVNAFKKIENSVNTQIISLRSLVNSNTANTA